MSHNQLQSQLRDRARFERWDARYPVSAACRFWWPSCTGTVTFGAGRTTELGVGGVFVTASVLPPLGSPILLEVDLPRLGPVALGEAIFQTPEASGSPFLLLVAEGTVSRHHKASDGFAAVISQTSFDSSANRRAG